ncbi:MAG: LysM peptidoglycan-binding domain-containing protein [Anaerolineales bacterium]
MKPLRQLSVGIIIGLVSAALVIGGIFLSLAETFTSLVTPTQIPPTLQLDFPTITPSLASAQSETPTPTQTPIATQTAGLVSSSPTTCAPPPAGWVQIFITAGDTVYSIAQRYRTTTEILSAANCLSSLDLPAGYILLVPPVPATVTVIPCGAPFGWVRAYVVQPGDNLFRISISYGTTVPQLQRANCMGSSVTIFPGQRLWVPNVPTRTPGVTVIPDLPTATPSQTNTSQPIVTTEVPTSTATQIPTTEVPSTPIASLTAVTP